MAADIAYYTTDVFTDKSFNGAQVAVFPKSLTLGTGQMQSIARELNLSETVFVISEVDKTKPIRLRVFTPSEEVELGSHTTLAAAYVIGSTGLIELDDNDKDTELNLHQANKQLTAWISSHDGEVDFVRFKIRSETLIDRFVPEKAELSRILNLDPDLLYHHTLSPKIVTNNGSYLTIPVKNLKACKSAIFNYNAWAESSAPATFAKEIMLVCTETERQQADFHLRLLGPNIAPRDNPPVGSALPAFAGYLADHKHVPKGTLSFTVERGSEQTRQSLLHAEMDNKATKDMTIRVGGAAVLMCSGNMRIPA